MRWAIPLSALILLVACGGSSREATPALSPAPATSGEMSGLRQQLYNGFLDASRDFVAEDPEAACDPLIRDTILGGLGVDSANKVLAELSLIDACHEAGELRDSAEWSDYYGNAPKP